jgi:beta-lactamase class A
VTDNLVTPEHSRKMREILAGSELDHKFVRALRRIDPAAAVSRKSGSWSTYHSDSVLVERDGHRYIAVALSNNANGSKWLGRIITKLDALLDPDTSAADTRSLGANQAVR